MIRSRQDLEEYLEADKRALGRKNKKPALNDYIWNMKSALESVNIMQTLPKPY